MPSGLDVDGAWPYEFVACWIAFSDGYSHYRILENLRKGNQILEDEKGGRKRTLRTGSVKPRFWRLAAEEDGLLLVGIALVREPMSH